MTEENMHPDVSDEPEAHRKIFVGGLSRETSDESLATFYQQWGETQDVIVMKDPATKRSRGFGFVTYKRRSMVDLAMQNRPHIIDGKTVDPKRAVPREEGQKGEHNISTKRLYLSNVREDLTEDGIKDYFSQFGTVEKVDIIMDKVTNKPRGFGFVTFDDHDAVDKCVIYKTHIINGVRCEAKKALNKDEMARAQQNRERLERAGRSRGMGRMDAGPGRGGYSGGGGMGGGGYGGGAGAGGYGGAYGGYGGAYGQAQGYGGYGGQSYAGYGAQPAQGWGDQSGAAGWGAQGAAGWGQQPQQGGAGTGGAGQWGGGAAAGGWQNKY